MTATEMLKRIEKLPSEWRHPDADYLSDRMRGCLYPNCFGSDFCKKIALDLHLRHIAEKIATSGIRVYYTFHADGWYSDIRLGVRYDTHPLALVAAAEAVVKEGGSNDT